MPPESFTVEHYRCDGIGSIEADGVSYGVHGLEIGLRKQDMTVQRFSDGTARVQCGHIGPTGCGKILQATQAACVTFILGRTQPKPENPIKIIAGECKWKCKLNPK